MKKYLISVVSIGLLTASCSKLAKEPEAQITISVSTEQLHKDFPFSGKFRFSGMVPLETNDKCRIADIRRVFAADSMFVVWDAQQKNVFAFDRDGKYVANIGRQGKAANEYVRISDVNVDSEKKCVYVLDNTSRKILEYSLRGDYVRSIPTKEWSAGFLISGGYMWLESYGQNASGQMLLCADLNDGNISEGYFSFPTDGTLTIPADKVSFQNGDMSLLAPHYLNTIYRVDGAELVPYADVIFPENNPEVCSDIMDPEFPMAVSMENHVGGIRDVFMVRSWLFFSFAKKQKGNMVQSYSVCYNTDGNETDVFDFTLLHDARVPVSPGSEIRGVYENGVIFSLDISGLPERLVEKVKNTDGLEDCSNESNPILVLYDVD